MHAVFLRRGTERRRRRTGVVAAHVKANNGVRRAARASVDFTAAKTNCVHGNVCSAGRGEDLRVASGGDGIGGMSSRPAARSFLPALRARAFSGAVIAIGLVFAACAGPVRPRPVAAVVSVENHSGYIWEVAFFDRETRTTVAVVSVQLAPRERRRLTLPPGGYRVRSQVAGAGEAERVSMPPGADAEVDLSGGRTYVWPLGTLLSAETPGS